MCRACGEDITIRFHEPGAWERFEKKPKKPQAAAQGLRSRGSESDQRLPEKGPRPGNFGVPCLGTILGTILDLMSFSNMRCEMSEMSFLAILKHQETSGTCSHRMSRRRARRPGSN